MAEQAIILDVGPDGKLCLYIPECKGKKVKVLYYPVNEQESTPGSEAYEADLEFAAASYLAAIEEDEDEDVIWRKYLK